MALFGGQNLVMPCMLVFQLVDANNNGTCPKKIHKPLTKQALFLKEQSFINITVELFTLYKLQFYFYSAHSRRKSTGKKNLRSQTKSAMHCHVIWTACWAKIAMHTTWSRKIKNSFVSWGQLMLPSPGLNRHQTMRKLKSSSMKQYLVRKYLWIQTSEFDFRFPCFQVVLILTKVIWEHQLFWFKIIITSYWNRPLLGSKDNVHYWRCCNRYWKWTWSNWLSKALCRECQLQVLHPRLASDELYSDDNQKQYDTEKGISNKAHERIQGWLQYPFLGWIYIRTNRLPK